jgi:hypothetical protein
MRTRERREKGMGEERQGEREDGILCRFMLDIILLLYSF